MILTASQFQKRYEESEDKVAFLREVEASSVQVLPDLDMKTALYHHEKGRRFRPSKRELESEKFSCPHCGTGLRKVRLRMKEHGYNCPRCRWTIHNDDIWRPQEKEVPEVREPGDATEDNPNLDISLNEALQPPIQRVT